MRTTPASGHAVASTSESTFPAAGLRDHGDRQVPPGAVDLAVNVWPESPAWLRRELAGLDLVAYPDHRAATAAAAARHGLSADRCLVTNGAAEAFWAIAYGLRPRHAACVHPSFTAPEAALRAAGVPVTRVLRHTAAGFALDPAQVPPDADLVVLGRPDNPTGRVEPADMIAGLARPGRVVVVDEAFAEFWPDAAGLAGVGLPGVLCVRSLTKVWGLAGLRVGYVTGPAGLIDRVRSALQPWPVSTPAAHAVVRLCAPEQEAERSARAAAMDTARRRLLADLDSAGLTADHGPLRVWSSPANYLLLGSDVADLRGRLLEHGLAGRRCSTFPGLDDTFVRLAVPLDTRVATTLVDALGDITAGHRPVRP
jgi:histidinol-phosphate aminotransferase